LKRNADEIALPPDHAALANGVKIVKTQFEIQRQQIEVWSSIPAPEFVTS